MVQTVTMVQTVMIRGLNERLWQLVTRYLAAALLQWNEWLSQDKLNLTAQSLSLGSTGHPTPAALAQALCTPSASQLFPLGGADSLPDDASPLNWIIGSLTDFDSVELESIAAYMKQLRKWRLPAPNAASGPVTPEATPGAVGLLLSAGADVSKANINGKKLFGNVNKASNKAKNVKSAIEVAKGDRVKQLLRDAGGHP